MNQTIGRTITCAFIVLCGAPVSAQVIGRVAGSQVVTFGLNVGVNVARATNEDEITGAGSRTGVVAGGFVERWMSRVVGFRVEGLYTAKGDKLFQTTIARDYLEFPLLTMFRFGGAGRHR